MPSVTIFSAKYVNTRNFGRNLTYHTKTLGWNLLPWDTDKRIITNTTYVVRNTTEITLPSEGIFNTAVYMFRLSNGDAMLPCYVVKTPTLSPRHLRPSRYCVYNVCGVPSYWFLVWASRERKPKESYVYPFFALWNKFKVSNKHIFFYSSSWALVTCLSSVHVVITIHDVPIPMNLAGTEECKIKTIELSP